MKPTFYEFFAGGGMARLGLGDGWRCTFANEWDKKKAATYRANFDNSQELFVGDVNALDVGNLPGVADLVWSSFPCQDLSLAGSGAGLKGNRSGTFFAFWSLMKGLANEGRSPKTIVLENVTGLLSSHNGHDFRAILELLAGAGYLVGAIVADAVDFVPQSRPRLFVIATRAPRRLLKYYATVEPMTPWHPSRLVKVQAQLSSELRKKWIWWHLPLPKPREKNLRNLLVDNPNDTRWHSEAETGYLVSLMDETNRKKLVDARGSGQKIIGTLYRRSRPTRKGENRQRAELRLDGVAGCLRTPAGGSSRQTLMFIEGAALRSRLLSGREGARLMGLPESYELPSNYNESYHLVGDGVAVPVVEHINRYILSPLSQGLR